MFSVVSNKNRAKSKENITQVIDSIKFVEPSLLRDKRVTANLRRFILDAPLTRLTVLGLVMYASRQLKSGAGILDVGAGDCPYKPIFADCTYKSTDFASTEYHRYREIDFICPADDIPVSGRSFDAIVCTEVLEHVPEPQKVLREFNRVLKDDGSLFLTAPLVIQLHEEPYDFYRYTPYTYMNFMKETGFEVVFITPRGGWIACIANALREMSLKPPRTVKGFFLYSFLFLPIFAVPMVAARVLPFNVFAWLDKHLDKAQKFTAGFALHARKVKDL